jgi:hypothetical protein
LDKNRRNQLCFITAGLFLILLGFYLLYYLRVGSFVASLVSLFGLTLIISGLRNKGLNRKKLEGEERKAYVRSNFFIIMLTGTIILFSGLVGAEIANYMHAKTMIAWFLGIFVVGTLILFAGRIVKAAEKPKKNSILKPLFEFCAPIN